MALIYQNSSYIGSAAVRFYAFEEIIILFIHP